MEHPTLKYAACNAALYVNTPTGEVEPICVECGRVNRRPDPDGSTEAAVPDVHECSRESQCDAPVTGDARRLQLPRAPARFEAATGATLPEPEITPMRATKRS